MSGPPATQHGIERAWSFSFPCHPLMNVHIVIASICQVAGRSFGELPDAFNGEDLTRDFGQDCRGEPEPPPTSRTFSPPRRARASTMKATM